MPTLNQLIRHGREEKRRTDRTRALDQCPQKQGVCPRVSTRTPKKPNSAPRKIAKVRLSNRHDIFAHIPGEGHNLQEHSMVAQLSPLVLGLAPRSSSDLIEFQKVFLTIQNSGAFDQDLLASPVWALARIGTFMRW